MTNTNGGGRKMSETIMDFNKNSELTTETKLLTPDDLLIQDRIARKSRRYMTVRELHRKQLQVLNQIMKNHLVYLKKDLTK